VRRPERTAEIIDALDRDSLRADRRVKQSGRDAGITRRFGRRGKGFTVGLLDVEDIRGLPVVAIIMGLGSTSAAIALLQLKVGSEASTVATSVTRLPVLRGRDRRRRSCA
jgi:hypothetical protein